MNIKWAAFGSGLLYYSRTLSSLALSVTLLQVHDKACDVARAPSAMQMRLPSFTLITDPRGRAVGTELHQHRPVIPQRYLPTSRKTDMGAAAPALG